MNEHDELDGTAAVADIDQDWQDGTFNDGKLKKGNRGNKGGGSIPALTAQALANHAGEFNEDYEKLHRLWLDEAFRSLKDHDVRSAEISSKRAEAIQSTCIRYSIGGKQEIKLDGEGFLEACEAAYDAHDGDKLSFLKELQKGLAWH